MSAPSANPTPPARQPLAALPALRPSLDRPEAGRLARLGFLPEQPYFYDSLTGPEYLEFVARLSGMLGEPASVAARHWLGRVGLGGRERLVLRKYSKGMLQRLGLAAAMIHEPALL